MVLNYESMIHLTRTKNYLSPIPQTPGSRFPLTDFDYLPSSMSPSVTQKECDDMLLSHKQRSRARNAPDCPGEPHTAEGRQHRKVLATW